MKLVRFAKPFAIPVNHDSRTAKFKLKLTRYKDLLEQDEFGKPRFILTPMARKILTKKADSGKMPVFQALTLAETGNEIENQKLHLVFLERAGALTANLAAFSAFATAVVAVTHGLQSSVTTFAVGAAFAGISIAVRYFRRLNEDELHSSMSEFMDSLRHSARLLRQDLKSE